MRPRWGPEIYWCPCRTRLQTLFELGREEEGVKEEGADKMEKNVRWGIDNEKVVWDKKIPTIHQWVNDQVFILLLNQSSDPFKKLSVKQFVMPLEISSLPSIYVLVGQDSRQGINIEVNKSQWKRPCCLGRHAVLGSSSSKPTALPRLSL